MITLVLTNRNRDRHIVKKCLDSLQKQSEQDFELFLVDYGSSKNYLADLEELISEYSKIQFISCPVSGQLWNKSRAINIALKRTESPYFLVGDIDLMFHPDFIQTAKKIAHPSEIHYFKYGFLSPKESLTEKDFENYQVDFAGNEEVTGTTLFPTAALMSVNGYDEFYHGWGAEDTDIHLRLKNKGFKIIFHGEKIVVKHQWHPKAYRSKKSSHPFHSTLERINQEYMNFTDYSLRSKINIHNDWGIVPLESDYKKLDSSGADYQFDLDQQENKFLALLMQMGNFENEIVEITIKQVEKVEKIKQSIKKQLGKKSKKYLDLQTINDKILELIISSYRNNPYQYSFHKEKGEIKLKIKF